MVASIQSKRYARCSSDETAIGILPAAYDPNGWLALRLWGAWSGGFLYHVIEFALPLAVAIQI